MSKTYAQAYVLGQKDGASGQDRLSWRAFARMLSNPGSYLPGAQNRDDQWIKGYRQGFEDKVRVQQVAPVTQQAMGLDSAAPSGGGIDAPPLGGGRGGEGGGGGPNTFAHRIAVAQSLYEQIVQLESFLQQTDSDFAQLFARHELLAGEFFNDLLQYHVHPRRQQLAEVAYAVASQDKRRMQDIVLKYQQAIHGKSLGQTRAAEYFSAVALGVANHLGHLSAALGDGDPRDYDTQLAVAQSLRRMFEALLAQLDTAAKRYHACALDHDELMRQDFDAFINENVEPRLQDFSDLWRAIQDRDLVGVDDVISRLRIVAST